MLCQKCNKNIATVFVTTIVNGQNSQMYLCTECAKEFHSSMNPDMQIPFPIDDILSKMGINEDVLESWKSWMGDLEEVENKKEIKIQAEKKEISDKVEKEEVVDIKCNLCNTTFSEYKKTGKLGCSKCYSNFEEELKPIKEGIYGYSDHIGKFPKDVHKDVEAIREVEELKQQLNIAIEKEEYEQAAELRDRILELESNNI